jgi:hypothetical protein
LLDLDELLSILRPYYSDIGRPSAPAPDILRSLALMVHFKDESIDAWVGRLRSDDLLAVICGFAPGQVPGVATFYAFQDRFWPGRQLYHIRKAKKKRKEKPAKGEKLPLKNPGVVKRIVKRLLAGRTFNCKEENVLHQILAISVVRPSLDLGLLGDPGSMTIAGDGSPYEGGGSPYGKKICLCQEKCDCERRFSDPEADWGWDSSHNIWFYGYTGYDITAAGSKHDLPIYIGMGQASRHDSIMGLRCLDEVRRLYPDLAFTRFLADSAHDAYPYYELLNFWQIEPFIDLNKRRASGSGDGPKVDDLGVPICASGERMVNWGYCKDRCRIKWRCPLACGRVKECSCKDACSSSSYGRVIYTKVDTDPRLFTRTVRGSQAWNDAYKRRTTCERSIKRKKIDYRMKHTRMRSKRRRLWQLTLGAVNQHLDAWRADFPISIMGLLELENAA